MGGWRAKSFARFGSLPAHRVGHVARHLRKLKKRLGPRGRERRQHAGERQRGYMTPHRTALSL
jgi:hypothetical protein